MTAGADITVVRGKRDRLFLENQGALPTLNRFADLSEWRRTRFPALVATMQARARRVEARGLRFLLVLAPEACGIIDDLLPAGLSIERPTMAECLAAALRDLNIEVICPSATFRAARGAIDLYERVDSHWSPYGAYLCAREIGSHLGVRVAGWRDLRLSVRPGYGDLSVRVTPEQPGLRQYVELPPDGTVSGPTIFDRRERNVRRCTCPTGAGRALVYRDSFATTLAPFLERMFAETVFVAGSPAMPDDAVDLFAPEIVILEIAERSLLHEIDAVADWPLATFEQMTYERANNPVGGMLQVQSAFAAEAGRGGEAIAAAAVASVLEGDGARLANLANALMVAGQTDPVMLQLGYTLCHATAPTRADRFLHYLHAQLSFLQGHPEEGFAAIGKALALQPRNAQYLYVRAVQDFLRMRFVDAFETVRTALEMAPAERLYWSFALDCARLVGPAVEATLRAEAERVFPGEWSGSSQEVTAAARQIPRGPDKMVVEPNPEIPRIQSILPLGADRNGRILSHVRPGSKVIEIGGSYNPLIRHDAGYAAFAMDYTTRAGLVAAYERQGLSKEQIARIGPLDFVCPDGNFDDAVGAEHVGTFDVVLSSHNIEHYPNPIRSLQAISRLLKPQGVASFAVPDHRGCFDFFRPLTTIGAWLEAYATKAVRHRLQTFFDVEAYTVTLRDQLIWRQAQSMQDLHLVHQGIASAYTELMSLGEEYRDTHFSVFTPSSFLLLIYDTHALGLIDLVPMSAGNDEGWEFYVDLCKTPRPPIQSDERLTLLKRIAREQVEVLDRVPLD